MDKKNRDIPSQSLLLHLKSQRPTRGTDSRNRHVQSAHTSYTYLHPRRAGIQQAGCTVPRLKLIQVSPTLTRASTCYVCKICTCI